MQSSKFSVKFYVQDPAGLELDRFVPLFHSWIQKQSIENHLLIDVADYKHVQSGPGIVLVAHEGNFSTDSGDGRLGLLYQRKMPIEGEMIERVRQVFRAALSACKQIEEAPALGGKVTFRTDDPTIRMHDRLFAPNTPETFTSVRADLEGFLRKVYAAPVKLSHTANDEALFTVRVAAESSPSVVDLLERT